MYLLCVFSTDQSFLDNFVQTLIASENHHGWEKVLFDDDHSKQTQGQTIHQQHVSHYCIGRASKSKKEGKYLIYFPFWTSFYKSVSEVELSSSCLIPDPMAFQLATFLLYHTPVPPSVRWTYRESHLRSFFNPYQLPSFTTWEAWVPFLVSQCEALTNNCGLFFMSSSTISAYAHSVPNLSHLC